MLGYRAGNDITSGAQNTLLGLGAGRNITFGSNHVAIGYTALEKNV